MKILKGRSLWQLEHTSSGKILPHCLNCINAVIADEPQDHDNCTNTESSCYCDCWDYQKDLEEGRFAPSEE